MDGIGRRMTYRRIRWRWSSELKRRVVTRGPRFGMQSNWETIFGVLGERNSRVTRCREQNRLVTRETRLILASDRAGNRVFCYNYRTDWEPMRKVSTLASTRLGSWIYYVWNDCLSIGSGMAAGRFAIGLIQNWILIEIFETFRNRYSHIGM